jgi:hypothetical protein
VKAEVEEDVKADAETIKETEVEERGEYNVSHSIDNKVINNDNLSNNNDASYCHQH